METLWAPWRIEYIKEAPKGGCFLCDILRAGGDDRANLVLKRGAACAVVMNRYPYNNGHLMVAPHRHVARLADLTPEERLETMNLLDLSVAALTSAIRPNGFNIGINLGRVAGAGLETHLHTHIVPRWNGDTNFMPVIGDTKVIPQALDDLWATLRPLFD
jgi:ATP adenylyltransferase